jgi:hypothetical protein
MQCNVYRECTCYLCAAAAAAAAAESPAQPREQSYYLLSSAGICLTQIRRLTNSLTMQRAVNAPPSV